MLTENQILAVAEGLPNGSLSRWSFSGGGRRRRCETNEGPGDGDGFRVKLRYRKYCRRNAMETEVIEI